MDTKNKLFAVVGTVAILATSGIVGALLFTQQDKPATTPVSSQTNTPSESPVTPTPTTSTTTTTTNSTASTGSYKDGTYATTVQYAVPHGGQNSLTATVVISSGAIRSVTATNNYTDHESAMYIGDFQSMVSADAAGQSLADYSPSRIGGASLTTAAFDDALTTIRNDAKT